MFSWIRDTLFEPLVVSDIFAISLLWTTEGDGSVCVQETNSSGCIGNQVCLEINVNVGLDEIIRNNEITIYPNPSMGNFSCTVPSLTGSQSWSLVDYTGATVETGRVTSENNTYRFEFKSLATGSYVLILDNRAVPVIIEK